MVQSNGSHINRHFTRVNASGDKEWNIKPQASKGVATQVMIELLYHGS